MSLSKHQLDSILPPLPKGDTISVVTVPDDGFQLYINGCLLHLALYPHIFQKEIKDYILPSAGQMSTFTHFPI